MSRFLKYKEHVTVTEFLYNPTLDKLINYTKEGEVSIPVHQDSRLDLVPPEAKWPSSGKCIDDPRILVYGTTVASISIFSPIQSLKE